jgi:hypothetical protein
VAYFKLFGIRLTGLTKRLPQLVLYLTLKKEHKLMGEI